MVFVTVIRLSQVLGDSRELLLQRDDKGIYDGRAGTVARADQADGKGNGYAEGAPCQPAADEVQCGQRIDDRQPDSLTHQGADGGGTVGFCHHPACDPAR